MNRSPLLADYMTRAEAARAVGLSGERISQMARLGQVEFVETPLSRCW